MHDVYILFEYEGVFFWRYFNHTSKSTLRNIILILLEYNYCNCNTIKYNVKVKFKLLLFLENI